MRTRREMLTEEQRIPALPIDAVLELADCQVRVIAVMEKLEPFGRGNPQPRFLVERVRLTAPPRRVGATGPFAVDGGAYLHSGAVHCI